MIINHNIPPIYDTLAKRFGVSWDNHIIITYAPDIHCKVNIPLDLIAHESVHIRQQTDMGVEIWWKKYLADDAFRLSQEVEAYTAQVRYIKKNIANRNKQKSKLDHIAYSLSSAMYGNIISEDQAREVLKIYEK